MHEYMMGTCSLLQNSRMQGLGAKAGQMVGSVLVGTDLLLSGLCLAAPDLCRLESASSLWVRVQKPQLLCCTSAALTCALHRGAYQIGSPGASCGRCSKPMQATLILSQLYEIHCSDLLSAGVHLSQAGCVSNKRQRRQCGGQASVKLFQLTVRFQNITKYYANALVVSEVAWLYLATVSCC